MTEWMIPGFKTEEQRDAGYQRWVDCGGTLCDGMCCHIDGIGVQTFRDGRWITPAAEETR